MNLEWLRVNTRIEPPLVELVTVQFVTSCSCSFQVQLVHWIEQHIHVPLVY